MPAVEVFSSSIRAAKRVALSIALVVPLTGFTSIENLFAPSADLWPRWEQHDPASSARIDFSAWDGLLKRYVMPSPDGVNRVDYATFRAGGRAELEKTIAELTALPISSYNRDEQFAYWVNLYNAVTIKVILDHHPVESIRDIDISPGLFASGPWDKELVSVEGEDLSLNDIEHRILRPIWDDPRIHYAVNCASIGCPNLAVDAYEGERLEPMLEAAARAYINDPRGVTINGNAVTVSKIYDWFQEDFGSSTQSVLAHLTSYAAPGLAERLNAIGDIQGTEYDWSLNDADKPQS